MDARATPIEARESQSDAAFDVEAPLDLPITTEASTPQDAAAEEARVWKPPSRGAAEWSVEAEDMEASPEWLAALAEPDVPAGIEPSEAEAEPVGQQAATELESEPEPVVEAPEAEPEPEAVAEAPDEEAEPVAEAAEAVPEPEPEPVAEAVTERPEPEPASPAIDLEPRREPEPASSTNGGGAAAAVKPERRRPSKPAAPAPSRPAAPAKPRYKAKTLNRLADTWEGIVRQFMQGGATRSPEIEPWFAAYDGEVHYDAVPEPFVGSLASRPKAVVLSLNPGSAFAHLHARDGHFTHEMKRLGGYAAWAAQGPDSELPYGRKSTNASRLRFLEGWLDTAPIDAADVVTFELYPWPTTAWTGRIELNPVVLELIDRYIIEPVAALRPPWVFAFGPEWFLALEGLGFVERVTVGGEHGPTWAGAAPSRMVTVFEHDKKRLRVVAMRHRGSPGPPKPAEVGPLRDLLARSFKEAKKEPASKEPPAEEQAPAQEQPAPRRKARARARSAPTAPPPA